MSFALLLAGCAPPPPTLPEPELYGALIAPGRTAAPLGRERSVEPRVWRDALERLEEAQRGWEDSAPLAAGGGFLEADPVRLRAIEPIARDSSRTEEALSREFSLEDLELLALLRSSRIKAAEAEFRGSLEAYSQVANIEDVRRRYAAFTEELMTGAGAMGQEDAPAMIFPYPGAIALKGAAVAEAARAARASLEIARRDAVTEARRLFRELAYLGTAAAVGERTAALLASLGEAARTRYESGRGSLQDTLRAAIEKEAVRTELVTLREERVNSEARLRSLLDLPAATPLGSPAAPPPSPRFPEAAALFPVALEQRLELRRLRAEAARMERMIEMAEKELLPGYSPGRSLYEDRSVRQVGTMAMEETFPVAVAAEAGAGQPRQPWSGGEAAYLRETRAALAALRHEIRAEERETASLVRERWFAVDRAARESVLYRQRIGELSRLAAEAADRGYRAGTVSFAEVLAAVRTRYDAEREAARREADLGIAAAELEAALGTTRWTALPEGSPRTDTSRPAQPAPPPPK